MATTNLQGKWWTLAVAVTIRWVDALCSAWQGQIFSGARTSQNPLYCTPRSSQNKLQCVSLHTAAERKWSMYLSQTTPNLPYTAYIYCMVFVIEIIESDKKVCCYWLFICFTLLRFVNNIYIIFFNLLKGYSNVSLFKITWFKGQVMMFWVGEGSLVLSTSS